MARYECTEGNSNKFWEIVLSEDDYAFTVRWGKIGHPPQGEQTKEFSDEAECAKAHLKLVAEKVAKGYKPVADVVKPIVKRDPNRKTLKIELGIYVSNCGDGSGVAKFFRDSSDAEKYAEKDDERYTDDTYDRTIEVYADTGELVMDDAEREEASDAAWDKRCALEDAVKKERDPAKKRKLKEEFKQAEKEWEELD